MQKKYYRGGDSLFDFFSPALLTYNRLDSSTHRDGQSPAKCFSSSLYFFFLIKNIINSKSDLSNCVEDDAELYTKYDLF